MFSIHKVALCLLSLLIGNHCLSLKHILTVSRSSKIRQLHPRASYCTGSTSALQSSFGPPDPGHVTIKLPIIQIFKTNTIASEFVCGNEMSVSIDKFQSTLKSLKESVENLPSSGNYGVSNIYSEDQLENILATTQDYVVLKLFRVGCKKCEKLEPIFESLSRDPVYSKFQFLQADVAYVETYKTNLKERLMALRANQDLPLPDDSCWVEGEQTDCK